MENSMKVKAVSESNMKKENESIMKHVIDLNERIAYIMEALKSQAEMLKGHQDLLERVRTRMGL